MDIVDIPRITNGLFFSLIAGILFMSSTGPNSIPLRIVSVVFMVFGILLMVPAENVETPSDKSLQLDKTYQTLSSTEFKVTKEGEGLKPGTHYLTWLIIEGTADPKPFILRQEPPATFVPRELSGIKLLPAPGSTQYPALEAQ